MIKDIVVNLSVGGKPGPARDYAVSLAAAFDAHLAGIAFLYDPIVPVSGAGYIPADVIDAQERDNEKATRAALDHFNAACSRAGVSAEPLTLSASFGGVGEQFSRIARRFDLSIVGQAEPESSAVRLTSTLSPCRAKCSPMSAPSISSCLPRSLVTITTSTRPALARSGMESAMARAAARLPSQHTITLSSLSGAFWM